MHLLVIAKYISLKEPVRLFVDHQILDDNMVQSFWVEHI